jgi:hypothetical protein
MSLAIKSESNAYWAIKRCMRLKLDAAIAWLSKALDSFSKPTVWTLHSAMTNIAISFNLDRLIFLKRKDTLENNVNKNNKTYLKPADNNNFDTTSVFIDKLTPSKGTVN